MNQFNELHGDNTNKATKEWNIQVHLKNHIYAQKRITMGSYIKGRINHHAVDNGDVDVYPSNYPLEYTSASVPDTNNKPIQ